MTAAAATLMADQLYLFLRRKVSWLMRYIGFAECLIYESRLTVLAYRRKTISVAIRLDYGKLHRRFPFHVMLK